MTEQSMVKRVARCPSCEAVPAIDVRVGEISCANEACKQLTVESGDSPENFVDIWNRIAAEAGTAALGEG
jgi:hypothetical protein